MPGAGVTRPPPPGEKPPRKVNYAPRTPEFRPRSNFCCTAPGTIGLTYPEACCSRRPTGAVSPEPKALDAPTCRPCQAPQLTNEPSKYAAPRSIRRRRAARDLSLTLFFRIMLQPKHDVGPATRQAGGGDAPRATCACHRGLAGDVRAVSSGGVGVYEGVPVMRPRGPRATGRGTPGALPRRPGRGCPPSLGPAP